MSEQNKDHIEDFFKRGAQKYAFDYKEEDWKKLEKRLEQAERDGLFVPPRNGTGGYWKVGMVIVAVLLIAGYFIWSGLSTKNEELSDNVKTEENATIVDDNNDDHSQIEGQETNREQISESRSNVESKTSEPAGVKNYKNDDQVSSDQHAERTGAANKNIIPASTEAKDRGDDLNNSPVDVNENNMAVIGEGEQESELTHANYLDNLGLEINSLNYQLLSDIERTYVEEDLIDKEEIDTRYKPFISAALYVAPDFSSVGLDGYTKPGKRVGLKFDYSLSKRFQVQAGFIYTDNIYTATGDEYDAPSDFWGYSSTPMSAEGTCKILDIPLGVRYNFLYNDRSRAFVNAGVSTYIMLNEYYEFEYEYENPGQADSWESQDVTRHIFGLVNVSAGYEHLLAPRWSFQAEPFIKVPVTGIGWGNVDLFTVGSYFSLKYYMFRGNRRKSFGLNE